MKLKAQKSIKIGWKESKKAFLKQSKSSFFSQTSNKTFVEAKSKTKSSNWIKQTKNGKLELKFESQIAEEFFFLSRCCFAFETDNQCSRLQASVESYLYLKSFSFSQRWFPFRFSEIYQVSLAILKKVQKLTSRMLANQLRRWKSLGESDNQNQWIMKNLVEIFLENFKRNF